MSSPLVALVLEGKDAVGVVRTMAGVTSGREAEFGTIRGDYSMSTSTNIIHVSDSEEAAGEEIHRFFEKGEIHDWDRVISPYLYSEDEV